MAYQTRGRDPLLDSNMAQAIEKRGRELLGLALIMLGLAELNGVASGLIYWTGMALVLGRILHAFGMINGEARPHKARALGILLTWLSILVTAVLLFWNVYQVNG